MRHPPAAEDLEQSQWLPLRRRARFPMLFVSALVAELPRQRLFCGRSRAAWMFSRVLFHCVLNDQYVHGAKVSHRILPGALKPLTMPPASVARLASRERSLCLGGSLECRS